jgi:hypothetical protein
MPNQSLLYDRPRAGLLAAAPDDAHRARAVRRPDLRDARQGGVRAPDTKPWLDKYYSVNENWVAEDRRKLLAFARDLLNSDYAGHRLTFQLFAQSPPFAHLAAVYRNFDWDGPLQFVRKAADLSERVMDKSEKSKTRMTAMPRSGRCVSASCNGMSHAACTVNVVTTDGAAGRHGVTVSAMVSVSADTPQPTLLVCIII